MTEPHPNGPRNIVTLMRDTVPLPRDVIERGIALDTGHPTLTQLRAALGVDLDLAPMNAAGFAASPARGAAWGDRDIANVIDAMYGAAVASRQVRVRITDDGVTATASERPVVIRGQELALWVFVENQTDQSARFAAESAAGDVAPRRTASLLVNVKVADSKSPSLAVNLSVRAEPLTVDVSVEPHDTGTLRATIIDDATGASVAARVYLRDALGAAWPGGATIRRDFHGNTFFHADGAFEARVCGSAQLRVVRGIEYEASEQVITVATGATEEITVRCRRWSEMAASGWYSGDVHVHLHYGGEYLLTPGDASLVQRAEDVHFVNMMVAHQGSGWVHDRENFSGADHPLSDRGHVLRWGEEYRNNFYGHMCMFGIEELVPPIYSGFPNSEHAHDLPANADAAAHCHAVGGTLSYAHPMFASTDLDAVFSPERRLSVEAKELPIDAALGHIDAMDVMSYPGNTAETCALWYRLLNCGLRLAATAGTDTFMNFAMQGIFSNPPAGDRAFVRVDGPLTTEAWCAGVRAGRTFVSNGPMLSLDVDGHAIGDEIAAEVGRKLNVRGLATSAVPLDRIELIVNGDVVASADAASSEREVTLEHALLVEASCWVALRASGGRHELVLDPDGAFAHTSPVYVSVENAPQDATTDAAYFVEWIDRLIAVTEERARFPSSAERDAVSATFRRGQAYYRDLISTRSA